MQSPLLPMPSRIKLTRLAALVALGLTAVLAAPAGAAEDEDSGGRSAEARIKNRGDIRHLPAPLKDRIGVLAARPHTFAPMRAFSEADTPSQLFQYYLLGEGGRLPARPPPRSVIGADRIDTLNTEQLRNAVRSLIAEVADRSA